jgi:hypothetical protein
MHTGVRSTTADQVPKRAGSYRGFSHTPPKSLDSEDDAHIDVRFVNNLTSGNFQSAGTSLLTEFRDKTLGPQSAG